MSSDDVVYNYNAHGLEKELHRTRPNAGDDAPVFVADYEYAHQPATRVEFIPPEKVKDVLSDFFHQDHATILKHGVIVIHSI